MRYKLRVLLLFATFLPDRRLYYFLIICTPIFVGCDSVKSPTVQLNDSAVAVVNNSQQKDTSGFVSSQSYAKQFPFGPSGSIQSLDQHDSWYFNLIGSNITSDSPKFVPTYPLPKITEVHYVPVPSDRTMRCENGKKIDDLFRLKDFQYQLPDIGVFECYYCTGYDYSREKILSEFKSECAEFLYDYYGYLVLLNKSTRKAKVLDIFYSSGYDGTVRSRYFYFDQNNQIYILDRTDSGDFEGEEETKTSFEITGRYRVTINPSGTIQVH